MIDPITSYFTYILFDYTTRMGQKKTAKLGRPITTEDLIGNTDGFTTEEKMDRIVKKNLITPISKKSLLFSFLLDEIGNQNQIHLEHPIQ